MIEQPREATGRYAEFAHREPSLTLGAAAAAAAWPGITYEEHPWGADPDHGASRRQRLLARGPYEAAVVPEIENLDPQVDSRTQALVEAATMEMVRFDAELGDRKSVV